MKLLITCLPFYFQADIRDLVCMDKCNVTEGFDGIWHLMSNIKVKSFCKHFCGGLKVVDKEQMKLIGKHIEKI